LQEIAPGCLRSERTIDPEFRRTIGRMIFSFELICPSGDSQKKAGAWVFDKRLHTVVEAPPVVNSMRFALLGHHTSRVIPSATFGKSFSILTSCPGKIRSIDEAFARSLSNDSIQTIMSVIRQLGISCTKLSWT